MSKEDLMKFKGKIIEKLPSSMFKVKLEENDAVVLGHLSGKMKKFRINVIEGDVVDVEISTYDITKGRIIFRYK